MRFRLAVTILSKTNEYKSFYIELASGSGARRGPNPGAHSVSASLCGKCPPYKRTASAPAAVSLAPQTTDHRHGTAHYIPYPYHCAESVRTSISLYGLPYVSITKVHCKWLEKVNLANFKALLRQQVHILSASFCPWLHTPYFYGKSEKVIKLY